MVVIYYLNITINGNKQYLNSIINGNKQYLNSTIYGSNILFK